MIQLFAESLQDGKWVSLKRANNPEKPEELSLYQIPCVNNQRLCDILCDEKTFPERGLPPEEGVSEEIKKIDGDMARHNIWYATSWISLAELLHFDWEQKARFGDDPRFITYRAAMGSHFFDEVLPTLGELGDIDKVRLVFFLS